MQWNTLLRYRVSAVSCSSQWTTWSWGLAAGTLQYAMVLSYDGWEVRCIKWIFNLGYFQLSMGVLGSNPNIRINSICYWKPQRLWSYDAEEAIECWLLKNSLNLNVWAVQIRMKWVENIYQKRSLVVDKEDGF